MGDMNPKVYRKVVRQKLSESDVLKEKKIVAKAPMGTPNGSPLDDLRGKLFQDETVAGREEAGDEYNLGNSPSEEMGAEAPSLGNGLDSEIDSMGSDELGTGGYIDPVNALEGEDGIEGSGPYSSKEDDLQDMATDLVAEVLLQLKDLRDRYKQESPEKAQLVRKLYDYILKGKEKIAAELIKAEQEVEMEVPPSTPSI